MGYYFGYGSNLSSRDFQRWCEARGFRGAELKKVRRAWLPDTAPAFHYYSRARQGGALDVATRLGHATPGVLFEVNEVAAQALDVKEGTTIGHYERIEAIALSEDGEAHCCWTYRVQAQKRRGEYVAPTDEYVAVVREALLEHGMSTTSLENAAAGRLVEPHPDSLFVYGTLKRGHCRHRLIAPAEIQSATCRGTLVDLGSYPGLILDSEGLVHGELFVLPNLAELLPMLDEVEDFTGYGRDDSLYRRSLIKVRRDDGADVLAWTYVYTGPPAPRIAGGTWRRD